MILGSIEWNASTLTTGSRDGSIHHCDVRDPSQFTRRLKGHKQEVCGLKWNPEETQLASGGNDKKLFVWDLRSDVPLINFDTHTAAVKAIAWSPHIVIY